MESYNLDKVTLLTVLDELDDLLDRLPAPKRGSEHGYIAGLVCAKEAVKLLMPEEGL